MCRSGNAPRTAFATADPEIYNRRSPRPRIGSAVVLFGVNTFEACRGPAAIKNGRRDAARASLGRKSLGWKSLGWKSLDEKHSDRHQRSDSIADFAARDWHHHDPVCRTAGGGCGDSGAGLEPLIFRLPWLAKADLFAGGLGGPRRLR